MKRCDPKIPDLPTGLGLLHVLTTDKAAAFSGYKTGHFRALHRAGKTPPAIKLSARKYGWRVRDLIDWQERKKAVPSAV
jgi:predicted DNA-binding transcriptional regulator AlpA